MYRRERLLREARETMKLLKYFKRSVYRTVVYHTLLKNFPEGARFGRIRNEAGITGLSHVLKNLIENGFVETTGLKGAFNYKVLQIENADVMEIFEKHDKPLDAYFELDNKWLELRD